MKELIEALHVIQDECKSHCDKSGNFYCKECPMWSDDSNVCGITDMTPDNWKINDEVQKALL